MSVRCITAVFDHSRHAGTELLMLVVLADYSDDEGNSYPSVAALARKCRMKPRNANYILGALQASGELRVLNNGGPKGTNRYRINLAQLRGDPLQRLAPLQAVAPLHSDAPLQGSAPTPAMECAKPLHSSADEPSLNRQEPSVKARKRATVAFDATNIQIPDWLPREAWIAWVADRKERRKPLTERAAAAQIDTLGRHRAQGHQPADVIQHSIACGYLGLFPPNGAGRAAASRPEGKPILDSDEVFGGVST